MITWLQFHTAKFHGFRDACLDCGLAVRRPIWWQRRWGGICAI